MAFLRYDYRDLVVIRDLLQDVDESDEPLNEYERAALEKTKEIINLMHAKRKAEDDNRRFGYDFNAGAPREPRFSRFQRGRESLRSLSEA